MFSLLKKLFRKKHPADLVTHEAIDIMRRYQRFDDQGRHELISAFEYAKAGLETKHGEIHTWDMKHKAEVAQEVLKTAEEGYPHAPSSSCGVALVALYLEAQTLPGDNAKRLVYLIDEWHRRATGHTLQAAG
jgi:hypothetical protein